MHYEEKGWMNFGTKCLSQPLGQPTRNVFGLTEPLWFEPLQVLPQHPAEHEGLCCGFWLHWICYHRRNGTEVSHFSSWMVFWNAFPCSLWVEDISSHLTGERSISAPSLTLPPAGWSGWRGEGMKPHQSLLLNHWWWESCWLQGQTNSMFVLLWFMQAVT